MAEDFAENVDKALATDPFMPEDLPESEPDGEEEETLSKG